MFESDAQALVNTVNTVGVMGKGVALQFKKNYHNNYKAYVEACKKGEVKIGKMFVVRDHSLLGEKLIINFPTKTDWRKPSEYEYVSLGLDALVETIHQYDIKSIALPPLGAGKGDLLCQKKWLFIGIQQTKLLIVFYLVFRIVLVRQTQKQMFMLDLLI